MLTDRQNTVLKKIIETYINDANPVGSKQLAESLECSSATIRNEMAFLEKVNYIEKTHTSSGRVPSELGYRYYVDNLMDAKEITGEAMLKLQTIFSNNSLAINDAIKESMKIISDLTHYTSIILKADENDHRLKSVKLVPLSRHEAVALIITNDGYVENRKIEIPNDVSIEEVEKTIELMNELLVDTPLNQVCAKLEFEIKPIISSYVNQHQALYKAFINAFNDYKKSNDVVFTGKTNLLDQPEFDSTDKMKSFIRVLEDEEVAHSIIQTKEGISIRIGSENDISDDCTLITTDYIHDGKRGTIAVLGPKRMEYGRVVSLLEIVKRNIGLK
jgi:heat-inducible transcriptional repressor